MNSRRCNLRTQRGRIPQPCNGLTLGVVRPLQGRRSFRRFRRLHLRLITVLPSGHLASLFDLTHPYAMMSQTFQTRPETPTSVSRTRFGDCY
jgi:hypothetical protein